MATITTYGTLETAVGNWLARNDLTSYVPNFIQNAEARIYREVRCRQMETFVSITMDLGAAEHFLAYKADVPATYIEYIDAYIPQGAGATATSYLLQKVSENELYRQYPMRDPLGNPNATLPSLIARSRDVFLFGPTPAGALVLRMHYYGRDSTYPMDDPADAPWMITDTPDLILYASLVEAAPFLQDDPRVQIWEALYQQRKLALMEDTKAELIAGEPFGKIRGSA